MVEAYQNSDEPWIGIDLGTTNSCVGLWNQGRVEILQNDSGETTTPSVVAFRPSNEVKVGDTALNQAPRNAANTIYDSKRLIGRRFQDSSVTKDSKLWPFTVENSAGDRPQYVLNVDGVEKRFHPEEISAEVLASMRLFAEARTGKAVRNAVVTVPAYFDNSQKQATMDACRIAGLDCKRMINEPTAAALAYGFDKISQQTKNILVYDLGGGTLDVSVLRLEDGVFEVLATRGDTHLGGQDIDNHLLHHCIQSIKNQHGADLKNNTRAVSRLLKQIRNAKHLLSSAFEAIIEVESITETIDFKLTMTRTRFEQLTTPIINRCLKPLTLVLTDAKVSKQQIDEIVLVGGTTRIPKIQSMLSEFFEGKNLNKQLHPDEAVAYGATI